jgi:7-cyano-7-deazaguanine synthase in queuosine biosynthesis
LQTQFVKSDNEAIQTAMANQVDSLTDDELRAMAKAKGVKLHHKTGRAKLLEALEL